MNDKVYALLAMDFGRIEGIEAIYADRAIAMRDADAKHTADIHKVSKKCQNVIVTHTWVRNKGYWWQKTHYEWDFEGDHYSSDFDDLFVIRPFSVITLDTQEHTL